MNRDNDEWEDTGPEGFTAWMREKDQIANGNLRKVIRLMKYLRDHKNSFTGTRSVILTTLLGQQVSATTKLFDTGYYNSIPSALLHIVGDLDAWLQARPVKPSIPDPSGSGVTFDHRWDQATYAYFRGRIHVHATEIKDAYDEPGKDASVRKWQAIFGDGFTAPEPKQNSGRFGTAATATASTIGRPGRPGEQEGSPGPPQHLAAAGDHGLARNRRPAPRRDRGHHDHADRDRHSRLHDGPAADQRPAGRARRHSVPRLRGPHHRHPPIAVHPAPRRRGTPAIRGHPHILQGHRLCVYLDPGREWDPLGGIPGFLERLWAWLGDAAAGRFSAATAMYHAVGASCTSPPARRPSSSASQYPASLSCAPACYPVQSADWT